MRLSQCLKAKIHRARITDLNKHYNGSITIGKDLMDICGIKNGEQVHIWAIDEYWFFTRSSRVVAYAIEGKSGEIIINGGAATHFDKNDRIVIAAFDMSDEPIEPIMIAVDSDNKFRKVLTFEDMTD